jgi:hypothetical protein
MLVAALSFYHYSSIKLAIYRSLTFLTLFKLSLKVAKEQKNKKEQNKTEQKQYKNKAKFARLAHALTRTQVPRGIFYRSPVSLYLIVKAIH